MCIYPDDGSGELPLVIASAGAGTEPDPQYRCVLALLWSLHTGLVSFEVPWSPMWSLGAKGCISAVCPGHILQPLKDVAATCGHLGGYWVLACEQLAGREAA